MKLDTPENETLSRTIVTDTPKISVLIKRRNGYRVHRLSRSLKRLGRSVGCKNRVAIARQAFKDKLIRTKLIPLFGRLLSKELKSVCKVKTSSVLRSGDMKGVQNFSVKFVLDEMKKYAPTVLAFLQSCVSIQALVKATRRKSSVVDKDQIVAVCSAILLRGISQRMNQFQRLVSTILYCGHCCKTVYTRLQRLGLCLSYNATIETINKFGSDYDETVLEWKKEIYKRMNTVRQQLNVQDKDVVATSVNNPPLEDSHNTVTVYAHHTPVNVKALSPYCSDSDMSTSSNSSDSVSAVSDMSFSSPCISVFSDDDSVTSRLSLTDVFGPDISYAPTPLSLPTFKLVIDNIDKNIKPGAGNMRIDHQTRSLHYTHVYAVRDRIDLTDYSDAQPIPDINSLDVKSLLPTAEDESALLKNFSFLIARVLKKRMAFFKHFGSGLERHIRHKYYEEMACKSEVFPLGIICKSEVSHADMICILEELHKYVPRITTTTQVTVVQDNGAEEESTVYEDVVHRLLLGGDQLTAARIRGAQRIRSNSERILHKLTAFEAVCEDWHAKGILLCIIWKRLYNTMSGIDGATMYQLRNLINRRNIVKDPSKNVAASEDFILLLTEVHIVAAAMTVFGMESVDDKPSLSMFNITNENGLERRKIFGRATDLIVQKFVDVSCQHLTEEAEKLKDEPKRDESVDRVQAYANELLTLGLYLMEFSDAIREGDGERIIRCWKFFLLLFKANGRTNYSIEALLLLVQINLTLSPRMAAQLKWNRTVNVHGRPCKNVSSDLHMEHLNRLCKSAITGMGSNVTEPSVQRIGHAIKYLSDSMTNYDNHHGISDESGKHTIKSDSKDFENVLKQIFSNSNVFGLVPSRCHVNFPDFTTNSIKELKQKSFEQWMMDNIKKIVAKLYPLDLADE